jgi:filamentous hemagglutinin family protein
MKSSLNHIFRAIWSEALNTWVAVSEITSAKGKRSGSCVLRVATLADNDSEVGNIAKPNRRLRLTAISIALACCFSINAQANPNGAQIINGTANINQSGNLLTVTNTPNAIINWQGFSIANGETTNFIQQSASSSILNRVVRPDPSALLGTLTSNGKVFLINPAGIMVGQGARIDVGGFVASTLNLSNTNFLAGKLNFDATPNAGALQNNGSITTPEGGTVYLIAPQIENNGIINTPKGETILAAGDTVQLLDTGTPGVSVKITGSSNTATNLGQILADSGQIGMVGAVVKSSGKISANSVVRQGGRIFLRATNRVEAGGSITANGLNGGTIEALGKQVGVMDGTAISASGTQGGGTILIGGDAHGANPNIQNAQITYVSQTANINSDATQSGNGGKVIVWADNSTQFSGNISAQGGALSGNGGWVEVSGKQTLGFAGLVNATAAHGLAGTLLLDPTDITISTAANTSTLTWSLGTTNYTDTVATSSNLNVTTLQNQLALSNVIVDTTSGLSGTGNITVQNPVSWSSAFGLTLQATGTGSITSNSGATITNLGTGGLTMQTANSSITLNGGVSLANGAFTATAIGTNGVIGIIAPISTGSGAINLNAGSYISELSSGSLSTTGTLTANAGSSPSGISVGLGVMNNVSNFISNGGTGAVTLVNTATTLGLGAITSAGATIGTALNIQNTGSISINAAVNAGAAGANITASNALSLTDASVSTSGNMNIQIGSNLNLTATTQFTSLNAFSGTETINFTGSGIAHAMNLSGGNNSAYGGAGAYLQSTGLQTISYASTGGSTLNINLTGGSATNNSQSVYVNTNGVQGALICSTCATFNSAAINSNGGQNITATSITLNGGSGGIGNNASISNSSTTVAQSITTTGAINLLGGSGAGYYNTSYPNNGVDSGANINSQGIQTISAASIALNGGGNATSIGGAILSGNSSINITTTGNIAMTGGASNSTNAQYGIGSPAVIGAQTNANITLNIGGSLTMTGGAGSTSPALIGNGSGTPAININATSISMTSGTASTQIGTLTGGPAGTLSLTATTGSITQDTASTINTASLVTSSISGTSLLGTNAVTSFSGGNTTSGNISLTNTATAMALGNISNAVGSVSVNNTGTLNINGMITATTINEQATTGITLGSAASLTASGTGNAIILNAGAGNFTNNATTAGAVLSSTAGNWLVYSTSPTLDTLGGLGSLNNFKQYGATYASTLLGTGKGLIYSLTPTLTVGLTGAVSKVYDGTTVATLTSGNFSTVGMSGDTIILNAASSGIYSSQHAGTGINVSVSGLSVASATNGTASVYGYTASGATSGLVGVITAKALTSTATIGGNLTKVYDGTTTSTGATLSGSVLGAVGSDTFNLTATGYAYNFNTAHVATANSISATGGTAGFAINTSSLGSQITDYSFTGPTIAAATGASITPAALTSTATIGGTLTKVYNGTTTASGASVSGSVLGAVTGDILTLNSSGLALNFNTTHVTTANSIGSSGTASFTIGSSSAASQTTDYSFNVPTIAPIITGVSITAAPLTSTAIIGGTLTKVYDGTTTATGATLSGSVAGPISGDTLTLNATGLSLDFNTAHVATANAIGASGTASYTIAASSAGSLTSDYNFTGPSISPVTGASITPAVLSIIANAATKTFDGNAYSGGNGVVYAGFVNGETATSLGSKLEYTGTSQGAIKVGNYVITPAGLTSRDYAISFVDGRLTVDLPTQSSAPLQAATQQVTATTASASQTIMSSAGSNSSNSTASSSPAPSAAANAVSSRVGTTGQGGGTTMPMFAAAGASIGGTAGTFGGSEVAVAPATAAPTTAMNTQASGGASNGGTMGSVATSGGGTAISATPTNSASGSTAATGDSANSSPSSGGTSGTGGSSNSGSSTTNSSSGSQSSDGKNSGAQTDGAKGNSNSGDKSKGSSDTAKKEDAPVKKDDSKKDDAPTKQDDAKKDDSKKDDSKKDEVKKDDSKDAKKDDDKKDDKKKKDSSDKDDTSAKDNKDKPNAKPEKC